MNDHVSKRYTCIRHDPTHKNLEYLYGHTEVVETVGIGPNAVDICCTVGPHDAAAEFLADYQIRRLASGREARGLTVYRYLVDARAAAQEQYETNDRYDRTKRAGGHNA